MGAPIRDDDPPHDNFDGIRFQATTDQLGVIAVPLSANTKPPVSFMPLEVAIGIANDISDLIRRVRRIDGGSYLAAHLDVLLDDLTDAIEACRPAEAPTQ